MVTIGPYIVYGLIGLFALFSLGLATLMLLEYTKEKKMRDVAKAKPREDSLADQIQKQFKEDDERKERILYTRSGVSKVSMKATKPIFSFVPDDSDRELDLGSQYDAGESTPFLNDEDKNKL